MGNNHFAVCVESSLVCDFAVCVPHFGNIAWSALELAINQVVKLCFSRVSLSEEQRNSGRVQPVVGGF